MKDVIIKHEFDRCYALFERTVETEQFTERMLLQNKIPGFLPCKLRYVEDIAYYGYDISSKKSLKTEYRDRKMKFGDIQEIVYGIHRIMKTANEFLLSKEGFLLSPEYIFKDLESEEWYCLYLPFSENEKENTFCEQYRDLADFLLDRTDHKDEHAVNVAYQFYKMSKEEFFSFDVFVGFMEKEVLLVQAKEKKHVEQKKAEDKEKESLTEENFVIQGVWDNPKKETGWWIPVICLGLGILLSGSYLLFPLLKSYALYVLLPGAGFIGFAILMAVHMIWQKIREKEEEQWEEPREPVRVEEYFDDLTDCETVFFDEEPYVCLKWKEGHFSKEHLLRELPVTVGKMKDSVQICIDDPSVSRLHARFKEQKEGIFLQDLDSTNGTFVNGKRLVAGQEVHIKRNDEIQFGKIIVNVV